MVVIMRAMTLMIVMMLIIMLIKERIGASTQWCKARVWQHTRPHFWGDLDAHVLQQEARNVAGCCC